TDSKTAQAAKNKKKNRRRKEQPKDSSRIESDKSHKKEVSTVCVVRNEAGVSFSPSPSRISEMQDSAEDAFSPKVDFEDADIDDGLDPAMKEELDSREIPYTSLKVDMDITPMSFDCYGISGYEDVQQICWWRLAIVSAGYNAYKIFKDKAHPWFEHCK
ncbi:hypothetical protein COCNU_10G008570, partial [Cocos nucifera]